MSKFLKFIVHTVILLAILDVLALAVPPFVGINTAIIDNTKESNMPKGSVTYAEPVSINELKVDDSILVQEGDSVYRYKILATDAANGSFDVYDQTDVEAGQKTITLKNTAPRVIVTVAYIGYLIIATQTMEGLIIIGLVILFLIILFILSELWRKDKRVPAQKESQTYESSGNEAMAEAAATREPRKAPKSKREMKKEMRKRAKEESKREKERARQEYEEATRQLKQEAKERKKEAKRKRKEAKKRARVGGFIEDYDPIETKIPKKSTKETTKTKEVKQPREMPKTQEIPVQPVYTPEDEANEVLRKEVAAATAEVTYEEVPLPELEPLEETIREDDFPRELLEEETGTIAENISAEIKSALQIPEEEPVKKMVIPAYTEEELLARAQEAGQTPNVVRDELAGVTLLDYSDIIMEEAASTEENK